MIEIDMTKEPEDGLLLGINLWTVTECKPATSKAGNRMLVLKLKCGNAEHTDYLMLGGGAWKSGRARLIALGLSETHHGAIDPIAFVNTRVWVATKRREYSYIDKQTGQPKTGVAIETDIAQLDHAGYQHELRAPEGYVAPPIGEETPF